MTVQYLCAGGLIWAHAVERSEVEHVAVAQAQVAQAARAGLELVAPAAVAVQREGGAAKPHHLPHAREQLLRRRLRGQLHALRALRPLHPHRLQPTRHTTSVTVAQS